MLRRLSFLLIFAFAFTTCKKENDRPQWDIEVVGPILYASLGIGQLVGDSSITTLSDGAQVLDYDSVFSDFNLDSVYKVKDTTIQTLSFWFAFPSPVPAGQAFITNNNNITLGLGNVQLKRAIVESGKIRLEIKNVLQAKVNFTYTIPDATKNGLPFTVRASVDSGSVSDPKYFTGEYDFSGYDMKLTGITGNSFNSISYNVRAVADSFGYPFNLVGLDTLVNLKTTLVSIKPSFVSGYLGQADNDEVNEKNIGIGGLIKSGTIELDSVQLNMDITNYIGAEEQGFISYMRSVNNRTGNTVDLVAPSFIQHYLNINRAFIDPSLADTLVPTHYSIQLDKTNSNISALMANIPDKISYDLNLKLNPLGPVSGYNDFIYSHRLIKTYFRIRMPLRFAMDQLTLADTVPFSISNATNFDPVGDANLTLLAENGFPFDLYAQLFLLDSNQVVVDSMLVPDVIKAAPYDINYRATGIQQTKISIHVDANRKQRLINVKRVGIRLRFDTPDYPQPIQMYSDYRLKLKLIADGKYSIR